MDEQTIVFLHDQRPSRQPIDQFVAIGRGENRVERIAAMRLAMAGRDRQQMKIVIAEHSDRRVAKRDDFAQHGERIGSAIDEIADQPQPIVVARKGDRVEELTQLDVTALDVADRVVRHERER